MGSIFIGGGELGEEDRLYDMISRLFDRVEHMSQDLSRLIGQWEAREKAFEKHEIRLATLETTVNQWTGAKAIIVWLIPTVLAIIALYRG